MITAKCKEALKAYTIARAKYGICGAKISATYVKMLDNAGCIIRGPFMSIQEFTPVGEELVKSLFV